MFVRGVCYHVLKIFRISFGTDGQWLDSNYVNHRDMADLKEIKKILLDIKRSLERNQQDIMSRLKVSLVVIVVVVVGIGVV